MKIDRVQIIAELCCLLSQCAEIIREQEEVIAQLDGTRAKSTETLLKKLGSL